MTASDRNLSSQPPTPARFDLLGIGCVAVDDLFYVDAFPPPDVKCRVLRSERQCGGLTATALVAAAKLGGRCAFAGRMGTDELSATVERNFQAYGIDLSCAVRDLRAAPIHAAIVVAEQGHTRNIFYDATGVVGAPPDGPPESAIRSARVLFIDDYGHEGNLKALAVARDAGIPVVADFERDDDPLFPVVIDEVGHLVLSEGHARQVTGASDAPSAVAALWNGDREAVVVTCGAEGVWYQGACGVAPSHTPAFEVQVVDTTGCGDVFHGAYALALARGQSLEERVRFASAAAALKAGRPGGQTGAPTAEELSAFLNQGEKR